MHIIYIYNKNLHITYFQLANMSNFLWTYIDNLLAETVPVLSSIFIPYSFFMGGLGVNAIFICIPLWMYNNNFMSEADVWDIFQFCCAVIRTSDLFSCCSKHTTRFQTILLFPYTAGACVKLIQSQSVTPNIFCASCMICNDISGNLNIHKLCHYYCVTDFIDTRTLLLSSTWAGLGKDTLSAIV